LTWKSTLLISKFPETQSVSKDAQKPPQWNIECQKPLHMFVLTKTCHPSVMGGF